MSICDLAKAAAGGIVFAAAVFAWFWVAPMIVWSVR